MRVACAFASLRTGYIYEFPRGFFFFVAFFVGNGATGEGWPRALGRRRRPEGNVKAVRKNRHHAIDEDRLERGKGQRPVFFSPVFGFLFYGFHFLVFCLFRVFYDQLLPRSRELAWRMVVKVYDHRILFQLIHRDQF